MGFNLGAFAGGVAQAGMASYKTQQELALAKAAADREAERLGFERERMLREKELYGQTQESAALLKQAYTPTEGGTSVQDIGAALPIGARADEDTTTPEYRAAFQQALAGITPAQQAAVLRGYGDVNAPGGKIASAIPNLQAAQLGTTTVRQDETGKTFAVQPLTGDKAADRYEQLAGAAGNPMAMEKAVGLKKSQAEIAAAKQNLELGSQTLDLNKFKLTKAKTDQAFDEKFQGALQDVMTESKNTLDKIKTTAETGGMKGLVDTFGSQLKTAFKHDISLVGNNIIVKDNDGKTLHTINSTAEAVSLLEGAAKEQFNKSLSDKMVSSGLFRNPEELNAFVKNQRDYNIAQMNSVSERMKAEASQSNAATTAGELAEKIKANLFGAQANQANAAAGASTGHANYFNAEAGITKLRESLLKADEKAREAAQPSLDAYAALTPAEQKGEKGVALIEKAAVAAATKSTDFSRLLIATGANKTPKPEIPIADQEKFVGLFGSSPSTLFKDAKDLPLPISKLNPAQLIQEIRAQHGAEGAGGLPMPDTSAMKKTGAPAAGDGAGGAKSAIDMSSNPALNPTEQAGESTVAGNTPYGPAAAKEALDNPPLGSAAWRAKKAAAEAAAKTAPAAPAAPAATTAIPTSSTKISKVEQQLKDTDRPGIIQAELDKAQARLAGGDATAQADVNSLTRELALLPKATAIPVTPQALANAEKRLAGDVKTPRNITEKDIKEEMAAIRELPIAKGMKEKSIREIAITMLSK